MKPKNFFLIIGIIIILTVVIVVRNNFMSVEEKVEKIISKMSLEDKIAQMLIIYYDSYEYDQTISHVIKTYNPGGFILLENNMNTYKQLKEFIISMKKDAKIPMFISIDQEGGLVQRLKKLADIKITDVPNMSEVGSTNDENIAYNIGKLIGEELNVFGINMDYAPVIDINSSSLSNVIGNRSFGNNANIVTKMALKVSEGLKDEGIIPVYKHFPGHGDTEVDPHEDLPVLNKTKEELYQHELKPFIEAINNNAEVIMIGHFVVPNISKEPSSLSKEVITDLLKEELGYKGLVITDALNMEALTKYNTEKEIIVKAINAGIDLLLMPGATSEVIMKIKEEINNGNISEKKIDESVKKILSLKYRYKLDKNKKLYSKKVLGSKEHLEIVKGL